jgi:hypothetical protein
MLGNGLIRSRREWAVRRYLLRAVVPGAGHDKATNHAVVESAHLDIDGEMDAGPEAGPFGLVGSCEQRILVYREEVSQDDCRGGRDRGVAGGVGRKRRGRNEHVQSGSAVIGRAVQ